MLERIASVHCNGYILYFRGKRRDFNLTLFFGCRPENIVDLMSEFAMKLKKRKGN